MRDDAVKDFLADDVLTGAGPCVPAVEDRAAFDPGPPHNRYEAQLFFGADLPQFVRESQLEARNDPQ